MKGSLIVVGFFIAGIAVGHLDFVPAFARNCDLTFCALCLLLFSVGLGIGCNGNIWQEIRLLNPRIALLPIITITGCFVGCAVAAMLMPQRHLADWLSIGSGFAYYSLSSIVITQYRGAELGTLALLANIIREIGTLLLTPLIHKYLGPLAPISAGGATTMDTTLPIIVRTCGQQYTAISLFNGFVVDFSVPFLVTLWCKLG